MREWDCRVRDSQKILFEHSCAVEVQGKSTASELPFTMVKCSPLLTEKLIVSADRKTKIAHIRVVNRPLIPLTRIEENFDCIGWTSSAANVRKTNDGLDLKATHSIHELGGRDFHVHRR